MISFKISNNLAEQISQYIAEKIIRSEFKSGERIFEDRLSKELGVSRSPVREALRILEKNGLVELIARKGARVVELTDSHIECLYDILTELYDILVQKYMEKSTEEGMRAMFVILKKMEDSARTKNVGDYYNAIFEFASVALRYANIPLLEKVIIDLWPIKRRIEYATLSIRSGELKKPEIFHQNSPIYARW